MMLAAGGAQWEDRRVDGDTWRATLKKGRSISIVYHSAVDLSLRQIL